jgi:hypothetical protein
MLPNMLGEPDQVNLANARYREAEDALEDKLSGSIKPHYLLGSAGGRDEMPRKIPSAF